MTDKLKPIIQQKQQEIAELKALIKTNPQHPIARILQEKTAPFPTKSFKQALKQPVLGIIAEIKRKSPSKGELAIIKDPVALAENYVQGGANALSVLTDKKFFNGSLDDLIRVCQALKDHPVPVLRKDFILDEIQIAEAVAAGANAVLCMVSILGQDTARMLQAAKTMGMEVLVEVHDRDELEIALRAGAEIIGVNNRNLSTMAVDDRQALKLLEHIPPSLVRVAESGILRTELAREYYLAGFDAVLIGEALVKSPSPGLFIEACRHA